MPPSSQHRTIRNIAPVHVELRQTTRTKKLLSNKCADRPTSDRMLKLSGRMILRVFLEFSIVQTIYLLFLPSTPARGRELVVRSLLGLGCIHAVAVARLSFRRGRSWC
jgi:hypothetical protein